MKKMKFSKKAAALAVAGVMLVGGVGGGTLAWLVDSTSAVTNRFTESDIKIEITETKGGDEHKFQMIPGWTLEKDPKVSVSAKSEDCYLFVKVEKAISGEIKVEDKTYDFDDFIKYAIDEQWTKVPDEENIYYMKIDGTEGHKKNEWYNILGAGTYDNGTPNDESDDLSWEDNQVLVLPTVTKEMMNKITDTNQPQLSFTAYAVQLWKTNKPNRSDYVGDAEYNNAVTAAQFTPRQAWDQVE